MSELDAQYRPGTYGCHEALHLTSVLTELVSREVVEHPAIVAREDWSARAQRVVDELGDLYQEIGAVHVGQEANEGSGLMECTIRSVTPRD